MPRRLGLSNSNNTFSISPSNFQVALDTGYQMICSKCAIRYGNCEGFIGREREIRLTPCQSCLTKGKRNPVDEWGFTKEKE